MSGPAEAIVDDRAGRSPAAAGASMRALMLLADRKIELCHIPAPAEPGSGEVQIRIKAIGLNHIDVWGWRGMAFAKRKFPLVVGVEAAGEITAVGSNVTTFKPGDRVSPYGGLTCGTCKACREGRDNLCENVGGIMGFHLDGFARELINMPARLVIPVPAGIAMRDAACAPIAFSTVQHMLFDNARLEPGETVLVHAGGLWSRVVAEVGTEFPEVSVDYLHVDAATIFLTTDPARFDVIVTDNLFGDILTDLAGAVTGGIGLAASGNVNPERTTPSMFEPVHGSAPDIAGQGIADPTAAILSAGLGWPSQSSAVGISSTSARPSAVMVWR